MFNISSIYPRCGGDRFDFDYYLDKHMPLSISLLSTARGFYGVSVERGMDVPEAQISSSFVVRRSSFVAMCHCYCDSVEAFIAAFTPHAQTLRDDIVNYTDIAPIIQINSVEIINQTLD